MLYKKTYIWPNILSGNGFWPDDMEAIISTWADVD